jgi:serine/threonine-protein kinase
MNPREKTAGSAAAGSDARFYAFGGYRLDAQRRLLTDRSGRILPISTRALDTLLHLVRNAGALVGKRELMDAVWPDTAVEENNLTQAVSQLRQLLGEQPGDRRYIATEAGRGYRFVAEVTPSDLESEREASPLQHRAHAAAEIAAQALPAPGAPGRARAVAIAGSAAAVLASAIVAWWLFATRAEDAIRSLAVLPFQTLEPAAADPALELGMADALISRLGASRWLVVRPLSSIRQYAGPDADPLEAGRALRVDAVLTGSIQRDGRALRVIAQLLRVSDGASLWTAQLDRPWTSAFALQDSIAEDVAAALRLELSDAERAHLAHRYTQDEEAYRLYVLGRYHIYKLTPHEIDRGIALLLRAIERDPDYALAHLGLAEANRALAISSDRRPLDVLPRGKAAALRAIEIDPDLAEAHASLCFIQIWSDWDFRAAEASCRRALALDPNCADGHRALAILLSDLGLHERAIASARRARELDPLSPITNAIEGHVLHYAGRDGEALDRLRATLELDGRFWVAHLFTGKVLLRQGKLDRALESFDAASAFSGGHSEAVSLRGFTLARRGDRAGALQALSELEARAASGRYVPPFNVAMIYNGLGDREKTLEWLERAYADRDVRLTFLRVEYKWDWLRADPRFRAIARRLRLAEEPMPLGASASAASR